MHCEFCDIMAYQMTLYKQSTVPSLLRSYYMPAVHGAASSQLVIGNELTLFLVAVNDAVFAHRIYSLLTS